jgi:cyanophycinase
VLERVPVDPRRWRDYINFILGHNEGVASQQERRARRGKWIRADELYFDGDIEVSGEAAEVVAAALREARRHNEDVGPGHILAAFFEGPGNIAAGTARYHRVTLVKARAAAGIPHERRVLADGAPRANGRRPAAIGPLVLLGGGYTPRAAIDVALRRAGRLSRDDVSEVRVVCVFAAWPYSKRAAERRLQELRDLGAADVVDSGLYRRADSTSQDVVELLRRADVIFLEGGKRELLFDALWDTPALEAMIEASDRGAVVVGYSAGSEVLGMGSLSDWESGDEEEPLPLLGWLGSTVVEPHCLDASTERRLRRTMKAFPGCSGLCVAHGGAVLVERGWTDFRSITPGHACESSLIRHTNASAEGLAVVGS